MSRRLAITAAVSGLMLSAALAQSPMPSSSETSPSAATSSTSSNFVASQKPDQWLASKFKGLEVLGLDDQKIGTVSDILFDKDGKIHAYVISSGGMLGIGAKEVALSPSSFQVVKGENGSADKLKISMTQDELKSAANFEPYNPPVTTGAGTRMAPPRPPASIPRQ